MPSTTIHAARQPLVSVVTPVYNTEKYLAECIESVLAQSYDNWEYIIINNCSNDRSLEIAQRYAAQDSRITIHNNTEFLTQMQNWNHAMRQVSPESCYCKVVHADDWLFPDCITQMVALAEQHPTVGIVGSYRLDETEVNLDGLPYPSSCVSGRDICRLVMKNSLYIFGSPTSLLIRSDLIRQREKFYNEAYLHADMEVCFELLQDVDFGFVHQVLTYTRRHNESSTTIIHRFLTKRLGGIQMLKKYGPIYLGSDEYETLLQYKLKNYYKFLARCVFEMQSREFWDYHKKELQAIGLPLNRTMLLKECLLHAGNVVETMRTIKKGFSRKNRKQAVPATKSLSSIAGEQSATVFVENK
ncbi:MAG: glycosyltransferase family 2 protein [Anaerolineae bacterium]|nr:glycosyltransferase family 2 protein [Anaerolineae bacterium]